MNYSHLDLNCFSGVFGILISGMILGSVVALCEMVKKKSSNKKGSRNETEDSLSDVDKSTPPLDIACRRMADGSFEIIIKSSSEDGGCPVPIATIT